MRLHELARIRRLRALAAELRDELAVLVEAQHILRAITIRDVDVAIRRDGAFGGCIGLIRFVEAFFRRIRQFEHDLAVQRGLHHTPRGFADVEVTVVEGQTVCAIHAERPLAEQSALHVVDEHVVLLVIREQKQATIRHLHHLMAVLHRRLRRVRLAPQLVHAITMRAMTDDRAVKLRSGFGERLDKRRCKSG